MPRTFAASTLVRCSTVDGRFLRWERWNSCSWILKSPLSGRRAGAIGTIGYRSSTVVLGCGLHQERSARELLKCRLECAKRRGAHSRSKFSTSAAGSICSAVQVLRCLCPIEPLAQSDLHFQSLVSCGIYLSAKILAFVIFGSLTFVEPLLPSYFFRVRVRPTVSK